MSGVTKWGSPHEFAMNTQRLIDGRELYVPPKEGWTDRAWDAFGSVRLAADGMHSTSLEVNKTCEQANKTFEKRERHTS